jgi:hypothetical protein
MKNIFALQIIQMNQQVYYDNGLYNDNVASNFPLNNYK